MATKCITAAGKLGVGLDILNFRQMDKTKYNPLDLLTPAGTAYLDLQSAGSITVLLTCNLYGT